MNIHACVTDPHELEVCPHLVGQPGHGAQLRDQVHRAVEPAAHVSLRGEEEEEIMVVFF